MGLRLQLRPPQRTGIGRVHPVQSPPQNHQLTRHLRAIRGGPARGLPLLPHQVGTPQAKPLRTGQEALLGREVEAEPQEEVPQDNKKVIILKKV